MGSRLHNLQRLHTVQYSTVQYMCKDSRRGCGTCHAKQPCLPTISCKSPASLENSLYWQLTRRCKPLSGCSCSQDSQTRSQLPRSSLVHDGTIPPPSACGKRSHGSASRNNNNISIDFRFCSAVMHMRTSCVLRNARMQPPLRASCK